MLIFGYTRISVDLQEDSLENTSIANQKRIISDYVSREFPDAELTIYEDRDRSGYTFEQRENYQAMRKRLMSKEGHILVVKDFSRFSRRNSLGLLELEILRDAGIRIISIGDQIDYPDRSDWMLIQFKFLMNEMPVTDTSKKIKQMIDNRQKSGQWVCAVPYGYRIINTKAMTYDIDPPAAEVVREIFRLYNNGWGYKKIANHLSDEGIPTPRANEIARKEAEGISTKRKAKAVWSISTIQDILINDFYIGTLRQRKYTRKGINGSDIKLDESDNIVIEQAHTPIIDAETFAYAQQQRKLRSKNNYRGEKKYATDYSGFLFCGDCGSPMFSMSRPDLAPAYTCGTYHRRGRKGCTSHHIKVEVLDAFLKKYLVKVRDNCESMFAELQKVIDDQPSQEKEIEKNIDSLEKQLDATRRQLKEIYKQKALSAAGLSDRRSQISADTFAEIENELTERIEQLENQLMKANDLRNRLIRTNRKAQTVLDVFDRILKKEKLDKRDIAFIVERITVYEGRIEVRLKSDVDELLSLDSKENTANFNGGSKDIVGTQKSAKRADKVFTVNVISSGDPLEIYTDANGEVIFKKYSPIGELSAFASQYAEVLVKATGIPVIICDRDHCIAAAGVSKKEVLERRVSPDLEEITESRRLYSRKSGDLRTVHPLEGADLTAAIVAPILAAGDLCGSFLFLMPDGSYVPSDADIKLAQIAAGFLGKQMEE